MCMTQDQAKQLDRLLGELSRRELERLRDEVDRCLRRNRASLPSELSAELKWQLMGETREIADLTIEGPRDRFSGRDHDELLYGHSKQNKRG